MNNFIKICTLFFVFFGLIRHVYAAEEQLYVIDPPEKTDSIESGDEIEPQITIIRREEKVIEEYKRNGSVYMVKVTPENGIPYFLIDYDGDGQLEARKDALDDVLVPQWVLFTWQ